MRQKLSWRNLLLVGFTLFSMFFGAGNLIFPPFLGAEAGTLTWHAMRGFLLSAEGLTAWEGVFIRGLHLCSRC